MNKPFEKIVCIILLLKIEYPSTLTSVLDVLICEICL